MRHSLAVPLAALAATVAVGGGYAIAGRSAPGTIHACAARKTGALRLARKCRHHETAVTWNKAGPPGQPGAPGAVGPSDGYSTQGQPTLGGAPGPASASLTLPAGNYSVTGECEASIEVFNSSDSLAFGFAIAELTIGPLNQAANTTGDVLDVVGASVPNEGISGVSLGKPVQYGATPLTDTAMVALPKGGTIYDTCENGLGAPSAAGGSTVQDIDYTTPNIAAIRLGALHQTTPG